MVIVHIKCVYLGVNRKLSPALKPDIGLPVGWQKGEDNNINNIPID